jgi:hypothetical protein
MCSSLRPLFGLNVITGYGQFNYFQNILRALSGVETRCLGKQDRVKMFRFLLN